MKTGLAANQFLMYDDNLLCYPLLPGIDLLRHVLRFLETIGIIEDLKHMIYSNPSTSYTFWCLRMKYC